MRACLLGQRRPLVGWFDGISGGACYLAPVAIKIRVNPQFAVCARKAPEFGLYSIN
jgi:hypothetical protein